MGPNKNFSVSDIINVKSVVSILGMNYWIWEVLFNQQLSAVIRNMALPFHWFPLLADRGLCLNCLNCFLFSAGPEFHCGLLYLSRYSQKLRFALALVVHSKRSFGKPSSSDSKKGNLQRNKPRSGGSWAGVSDKDAVLALPCFSSWNENGDRNIQPCRVGLLPETVSRIKTEQILHL